MGIISYIKERQTGRRLSKLKGDLLMIHKELEFNPFNVAMPKYLSELKYANLELIENLCWGSGNGAAIRQFYTDNIKQFADRYDQRKSYFAAVCPENIRYIDIGLAKLISETMANLVFGNGYVFNTKVYSDEERVNEDTGKSSQYNKALYHLLEGNVFSDKLTQAATKESIAGDVAFKISFDFNLSYLPIIEVVDRRFYEIEQSRGIIKAIVFKSFYDKIVSNNFIEHYVFKEIYGHDNYGNATIESKLYLFVNGEEIEKPLTAIDETSGIEPLVTFEGYKGNLAWHKKNKAYTGILANYPYGSSDYSSHDNFDGANEAASVLIAESRENRPIRLIDKELLTVNDNGGWEPFNHFITNYIRKEKDQDQNAKDVNSIEFTDKTEQHLKKLQTMIEMACADCKISPISLGLSGNIAVSSGDKTLRERTEISRETANKKKDLWAPFLDIILTDIMKFAKYLCNLSSYPITKSNAKVFKNWINDIDLDNLEISTFITPYDVKSIEDNITTWGNAINSGVASTENAVRQIYGSTMTEEELEAEVNRIKIEKNITLDNPELLQFEDTK